mgnify:CR=1 FL=1
MIPKGTIFAYLERRGDPIAVVTAYDFPTARIADQAGVEILLVGDSLGTVVLGYGQFCTVFINTLILAFAVFMVVRAINKMRKQQAIEGPPQAPPAQEVLLTEIRDLLKTKA